MARGPHARLGAGLAYYARFTIVPFFALTVALAEQLFGLVDMAGYLSDLWVPETRTCALSRADTRRPSGAEPS